METYAENVEAAKAALAAAVGIRDNESLPTRKGIVGVATWASGETKSYQDAKEFVSVVKSELPYRSTSGFAFYNLSSDPTVCKALDDLVYSEFGEENPNDMSHYEEHAELASKMNALGFERTYEPGFSKDLMMWKESETGRTFGLDHWRGVKGFLEDHEARACPKPPDRPRSIKEVMASAQARAEARAAARAEERSQLFGLNGRGEM